jgi:hypothetical protein
MKKREFFAKIVPLILATHLLSIIPMQEQAYAVLSNYNNATAIDPTQISAAQPSCQDFCSNLIGQANGATGKAANGSLKNTSGGTGWTATDDQYCADHGVQTNASVLADGNASTTAVASSSCNINIAPGENCSAANAAVTRCIWYASQAEPQCMAYLTSQDAHDNEIVPIIFDTAAAVSCGLACYNQLNPAGALSGASEALDAACEVVGLGAGVSDMLGLFSQQSSAGARAIGSIGAVGAGVAAGTSVYQLSQNASGAGNWTSSSSSDSGVAKKWAVCATAALFALTAVIRGVSEKGSSSAKTDACNSVHSLMSKATPVGYTGSPVASGVTTTTTSSGSTLTAATGTTGSIGNTSASAALNSGQVPQACLDQGISCQPSTAAATDGGILAKSGLDTMVAPLASKIGPQIAAAAESGDLGNALGNAMTAAGLPSDFAKKFVDLAGAAYEAGPKLASALNVESQASAKALAGIHAPAKSPELFGAKSAAPTTGTTTEFNDQNRAIAVSSDIWHTGYNGSIFDIVSEKISSSKDRINIEGWASSSNNLRSMLPAKTK